MPPPKMSPQQDDKKFHYQLELEQLQAKVRLLAGGCNGEQLAEVLLEREEELRAKEVEVVSARRQLELALRDCGDYEVRNKHH